MLHEFLQDNREKIVARARMLVAARLAPRPSVAELTEGLPVFLTQLTEALSRTGREPTIEVSAGAHGAELLKAGFTYAQVVHDYGSVCQAITGLADELKASISPDEFRTLNRCLDDAIAGALTEFTRIREESIDHVESEHVVVLGRELHGPLAAASLAYQVLKTGSIGIAGSTGTELGRNLRRVSALIDRTMAQVRLSAGVQLPERISIFAFIEELEVGAALEANARGLALSVRSVGRGIEVDVDRQLLGAAVSNLVQNALQFTRPGGQVTITTSSTADGVRIEVQDECGGLPPGREQELARAFARSDRAGADIGPGLSVVHQSVKAIGAELRVRDIPGQGCVLGLELPMAVP
jgi:signal transduction histidine kinase